MNFDELTKLVCASNRKVRIRTDSRQTTAGDVFVAVAGTVVDGHDFISQAVDAGAKYIVSERAVNCKGAEVIVVDNSTEAAGSLAQAANGRPASKLTSLAVTGTNGKTTVAYLVRSVIKTAGEKCGLISTVTYDSGEAASPAELTTPDCLCLADMQRQMVKAGCRFMVIEASSHALAQNRLAGVEFRAAAFTNLAGDHLDYHGSEEAYLAAKLRLFENLPRDSTAVLNRDSPQSQIIAGQTKSQLLWYGLENAGDVTAEIKSMDIEGSVFELQYAGRCAAVKSSLLGGYNISNHLAAAGLCLAAGFDLETVAEGLSALKTVPGRLERLEWGGGFAVFVDYAHTDDALNNVLSSLKGLCKGRLIVVFGCGGDRDRTKRPRMAGAAERFSDYVIVTSDNPRTENPAAIIGEIITGFENPAGDTILVEPDRKKAIELAIRLAGGGDIVLIAGKGHESCQIIGDGKIDFSDKEIALGLLKQRR